MLVPAAQYLTYAEAVGLYNELLDNHVVALVKSSGPPSLPFGDGLYYQLLIEEADVPTAQDIIAEFERRRTEILPESCPRCHSSDVWPKARTSWLKRLFYSGTTLYQCRRCGREFSV